MTLKDQLESAKDRLSHYYEAEKAVLAGQEYRIGSRWLRRADLKDIQKEILKIKREIVALEKALVNKGRRRVTRITIRDL